MARETMNRHNPSLSDEAWSWGELDLQQPPIGMRLSFDFNSKEKFISSGKYQ
jgi:hypothetical protein